MTFLRRHAGLADTFVDVGANVGLFSVALFDRFSHFICFEPVPSSFRALSETCALNPSVQCESHHIGVGDRRGDLFFEEQFDFSTTNRFVAEAGTGTIRIPVDTLDHVLGERFDALVMKIDVEGYEERIFMGAERLFKEQRVKLVMFERLGRTSLDNVRNFLEARGYVLFRIDEDMQVTTDERVIAKPCINLFACLESLLSEFGG